MFVFLALLIYEQIGWTTIEAEVVCTNCEELADGESSAMAACGDLGSG